MVRKSVKGQGVAACLVLALLTSLCTGLVFYVAESGPVVMTMGRWLAPFGISFAVDMLGASFALAASLVALFCALYALFEVEATGRRYGFFPFLLFLLAGVYGAFFTGDIFNLYVWFEVLLIASFGLIVLGNKPVQLEGAIKYAVLNLTATTLFLIATGLLYGLLGTLNMADIAVRFAALAVDSRNGPLNTIAALYLLAFAMKAAAFPLFFWLPAAYHTPKVAVSAVFAGLLTKVGVYALLRTLVMLMPDARSMLGDVLLWGAAATMLIGVLGALGQSNIRRMMGYLVISGIGMMLCGAALASAPALTGALFYALHSMVVMSGLYLACGLIIRLTGREDMQGIGGLYVRSPLLSALFLVLALAAAGLPPFSGFWPKLTLVQAALSEGQGWLAGAILLTGFLTTIALGRVWAYGFWRGPPKAEPAKQDHGQGLLPGLPRGIIAPVGALCLLVVVMGLLPIPVLKIAGRSAEGLFALHTYEERVLGEAPAIAPFADTSAPSPNAPLQEEQR